MQIKVPDEHAKLPSILKRLANHKFLQLFVAQPTLDPLNPLGPSGLMRPGRPWATLGRLFPSTFTAGNSEEL